MDEKGTSPKKYEYFAVVAFLLMFFLLAVSSMRLESPTFDEVIHLPAGYSYLAEREIRISLATPPLMRLIAATPLMFMNLNFPRDDHYWIAKNELFWGHSFMYAQNHNSDQMIFWGRLMIVLVSLLLGVYVFKWSRELYGVAPAFLALFLYALEPNILAHSRLVTTDLGLAAFSTIALYYFYRLYKRPSGRNLLLSGLTFGLAQVTKFSAILLVPTYLLLSLVKMFLSKETKSPLRISFLPQEARTWKEKALVEGFSLIVIFLVAFAVIFGIYGGQFKPIFNRAEHGGKHSPFVEKIIPSQSESLRRAAYFFLEGIRFPAGAWFRGLFAQLKHSEEGHAAFFMGKYSRTGWWYYYPVAFLIKTPIPLLILIILSIIFFKKTRANLMEELFIIVPMLVLFIASLFSHIAIGLRYLLPIYPLLFIFVSKVLKFNGKGRALLWAVLVALILWFAVSSFSIYPHYLAYFNELVGGPDKGYKYLVDSNLDWGQDLKGLKKYMDDNDIGKIKLAYFGTADPNYYRISYRKVTEGEMHRYTPGIYAISATELQNALVEDKNRFSWIKRYKPKDEIGYSIFIYEIR